MQARHKESVCDAMSGLTQQPDFVDTVTDPWLHKRPEFLKSQTTLKI